MRHAHLFKSEVVVGFYTFGMQLASNIYFSISDLFEQCQYPPARHAHQLVMIAHKRTFIQLTLPARHAPPAPAQQPLHMQTNTLLEQTTHIDQTLERELDTVELKLATSHNLERKLATLHNLERKLATRIQQQS